jgi:hypothetical protein
MIHGGLNNPLDDTNNQVVIPGDIAHSMLLKRMTFTNELRMPPIGLRQIDEAGIALIAQWIEGDLTNHVSFTDWQFAFFRSTNSPGNIAPEGDFDGDGISNYAEFLLRSNPTNGTDSGHINLARGTNDIRVELEQFPGIIYRLEVSSSLVAPHWNTLDLPEIRPIPQSSNLFKSFSLPLDLIGEQFYRLRVLEP